jgi:ubiquinone/menaquinone biosynthesis C-methylase UbiE
MSSPGKWPFVGPEAFQYIRPMDDFELLIDLHRNGPRQGPGSDAATELALTITGIDRTAPLTIADIGCGTGASTLALARLLNARIMAVDLFDPFLEILQQRAADLGVEKNITTLACSMDDLPFADASLDVIWSEGAIYNIGFENGIKSWRRFLKAGGLLVASEMTWLTDTRPADIQQHWEQQYPEIGLASAKMGQLEQYGYTPCGYFALPASCWFASYYDPMQMRFDSFLERHGNCEAAQAIVSAERREIELYREHQAHYGYSMYIARKTVD